MHRKIHPMVGRLSCGPMGHGLRPRSFRRIDWDNFGFRGWAVEIGSLFFFWRPQNFKVDKFGEVLCSERFGPDRQMDDVVLEMFISKRFG